MIELMYATGYFMIGLVGLMCFQVAASYTTMRAANLSMATNLVGASVEQIRVTPLAQVLGTTQPLPTSAYFNPYYDRFGNPTASSTAYFTLAAYATQVANAAYYELHVNISWKQNPSDTFVHNIDMYTRIPTE